jgi:peptide/nickel transport system substrate-binding protein
MSDRVPKRLLQLVGSLAVALAVVGRIAAQPPASQDEAGASDLMAVPPFDRITLVDGTVLEVEPLSPRPLPEYDSKKDPTAKKRLPSKDDPKSENVVVADGKLVIKEEADRVDPSKVADGINVLRIKPLREPNVYILRRANVKSIEYFEDMLLAESERRSKNGDFVAAFEILLGVRRRSPGWPGLGRRANALLFAEGKAAVEARAYEGGLRLLNELREQDAAYPGLSDALAAAYGGRIRRAIEAGAFYEGREQLHALRTALGDHPEGRAIEELFRARANALVQQSEAAKDAEGRLDALGEAQRVWPSLEGLESRHRAAFEAMRTLDVGVYDTPASLGPWQHSAAEQRLSALLYLPILAAATEAARRGERPDQLAAQVEVGDLGRKIDITIRDGVTWSDGSGPVAPVDLVNGFGTLVEPGSPRYEGRWATLLDAAVISGPRSVTLRLSRSPLDPAALLTIPVGAAHAGSDGRITDADGQRRLVVSGTYRSASGTEEHASEGPIELRAVHEATPIRRVREWRVDDGVAALRQGRISLLAGVPIRRLGELTDGAGGSIRVGRFADARLHIIAVDGRAASLRNRTLRRALSDAIDRATLLATLSGTLSNDPMVGVLDGPAPRGSFAQAPGVAELEYHPILGRMLAAAARKELELGPIALTLDYPRVPDVERVVPRLVEAWKEIGVAVEPRGWDAGTLEARLRAGEAFQLAYRIVTVGEPLRDLGPAVCPGYDAPGSADALASIASPRIVQLLLRLEQAPEIPTARGLAIELDRACRDELPILPLWQLPEHYAWHTRLTGPPETTPALYQGIETWTIEPPDLHDPW